ncbi:hypothetical protein LTR64_007766 [Lithohypha guttulata]|uniref:uncharacterized protein n=1 Tax=Lithohypha guttulata TaxID=1690604 RepID=UPI002DDF251C|nr:hypothetical protein LTR51_007277 [Lithohypha guttulata]
MTTPIEFVSGGDLVVAFGQGDAVKIAKVHKSFLQAASPVFATLLGSQFQEGHKTYSVANPLPFPEDDPTAMLNLCRILHWQSGTVDISTDDWLQQLAIVCDKYRCAQALKEFFQARIDTADLSYTDSCIISLLVGDLEVFEEWSSFLIRNTRVTVEAECHKDLLQLLPKNILGDLAEYRRSARAEYALLAQAPMHSMRKVVGESRLCWGVEKKIVTYWYILGSHKVLCPCREIDVYLPDLHHVMTQVMLENSASPTQMRVAGDLEQECRKSGFISFCGCNSWKLAEEILSAANQITSGKAETCKLCYLCFQSGKTTFIESCKVH